MIIRELEQYDDFEQFAALLNHLSPTIIENQDWFTRILQEHWLNGYKILVALDKDVIVGTVSLGFKPNFIRNGAMAAQINDLVVLPEYRGLHVAFKLINQCIYICQNYLWPVYKIILDCKDELGQFYEKQGFKRVGGCFRLDLGG